jgi:hypothetical protein
MRKKKTKTVELHISFREKSEIDLITKIKKRCGLEKVPLKTLIVGSLYTIDNSKKSLLDYILDVGRLNDKKSK